MLANQDVSKMWSACTLRINYVTSVALNSNTAGRDTYTAPFSSTVIDQHSATATSETGAVAVNGTTERGGRPLIHDLLFLPISTIESRES